MWRKKYSKLHIKFIFSSKIVLKIIPALLNMFITFNFFVPTLLGIVFLCCKAFEIVKVGSSTLLAELFFQQAFYPICVAWLVYLTRLPSYRLHAYCIFEAKQAIDYSIWPMPKWKVSRPPHTLFNGVVLVLKLHVTCNSGITL